MSSRITPVTKQKGVKMDGQIIEAVVGGMVVGYIAIVQSTKAIHRHYNTEEPDNEMMRVA